MTKEISKLELFCDDNSVGRIQRALSQIKGVYDVKVVPVINAEAKPNGKVQAETDGSLLGQFEVFLRDKTEISPKGCQDWLESVGRSRLSASYLLKQAKDAKILAKRGKSSQTRYLVK